MTLLSGREFLRQRLKGDKKCSWCEKESGVRTAGSHGICRYHELVIVAGDPDIQLTFLERIELRVRRFFRSRP